MTHEEFLRLVGTISLTKPKKSELRRLFMREFEAVQPTRKERKDARVTFDLSFRGHLYTQLRKSGEAYIFHPFRAAIECIRDQAEHGVKEVMVIFAILLHDSWEEAKGPHTSRILLTSSVVLFCGELLALFVHLLTKHKERGETNAQYMARLATCIYWIVILAKLYDRGDNLDTLKSMPLQNQIEKVRETKAWLSPLVEQALMLMTNEFERGLLSEGFLELLYNLVGRLKESIRREEERIRREIARLGIT